MSSPDSAGIGMIIFAFGVTLAAMTIVTGDLLQWIVIIPGLLVGLSAAKALSK